MSDEKDPKKEVADTKEETAAEESSKKATQVGDDKKTEDASSVEAKVKEEKDEASLKVEKDDSGLEQLPEDIVKKLEKKKAENEQKGKKGAKVRKKKKKVAKKVPVGKAFIKSSYNNTIVTLTDLNGSVISWASAGVAGFKGPKKATPYAAQIITRIAVGKARQEFGLSEVSVFVKGIGTGREAAIRSLNNNGLIVTSIQDITPKPHNGCRVRRPRRV